MTTYIILQRGYLLVLIWTLGSAVYCRDCKTFCPLSSIHPLTARPVPPCSVSITPLPCFVRMFYFQYYVVAMLIDIQFVCSQICAYTVYTHSSQYRDTGQAEGINKLGQH